MNTMSVNASTNGSAGEKRQAKVKLMLPLGADARICTLPEPVTLALPVVEIGITRSLIVLVASSEQSGSGGTPMRSTL